MAKQGELLAKKIPLVSGDLNMGGGGQLEPKEDYFDSGNDYYAWLI